MKKVTYLGLILGVGLLLSACTNRQQGKVPDAGQGMPTDQQMEQSADGQYSKENPFTGGLKAAVALGVPMKCTYKVEGDEFEGVIKGKQFRGQTETDDGQVSYVLLKENCMYSWGDTMENGLKICFDEDELSVWDQADSPNTTTTDTNLPYEYRCHPAMVLDSQFDLPAGVEFMDLGEMMESFGQPEE